MTAINSLSSVGSPLESWRRQRSALSESLHDIYVVSRYYLITRRQIVRGGLYITPLLAPLSQDRKLDKSRHI